MLGYVLLSFARLFGCRCLFGGRLKSLKALAFACYQLSAHRPRRRGSGSSNISSVKAGHLLRSAS